MEKEEINLFVENSNYRNSRRCKKNLKEKLVEYKGGKCEKCGYNKCITALEFHHINPEEKEFNIDGRSSFEKSKKEVDKCILVCANCHREIHYEIQLEKQKEEEEKEKKIYAKIMSNRASFGVRKIKNSHIYLQYTDVFNDIKNGVKREEILKKYHINNKTFNMFLENNNIEYSKQKTVPNKPNKEELIELLKSNSKSAIGRMFGVSCGAVIKWCKKYNL